MKSLKAEGVDVIGWQYVNLSDNASLEQTAKEIKEKYHDLELLVNNAGIPGDMEVASYESELKDVIDTITSKLCRNILLDKGTYPITLCKQRKNCEHNRTIWSKSLLASNGLRSQQSSTECNDQHYGYGIWEEQHTCEIFNIHPGATTTDLNNHYTGPGSHSIDVVSEKIAEVINDGEKHQGEFVELYPIVDEGR